METFFTMIMCQYLDETNSLTHAVFTNVIIINLYIKFF